MATNMADGNLSCLLLIARSQTNKRK